MLQGVEGWGKPVFWSKMCVTEFLVLRVSYRSALFPLPLPHSPFHQPVSSISFPSVSLCFLLPTASLPLFGSSPGFFVAPFIHQPLFLFLRLCVPAFLLFSLLLKPRSPSLHERCVRSGPSVLDLPSRNTELLHTLMNGRRGSERMTTEMKKMEDGRGKKCNNVRGEEERGKWKEEEENK